MTHTPGPWTFIANESNRDECEHGAKGVIESGEGFIASIWADTDALARAADANAHLVAAAPDLLAALKTLLTDTGDEDAFNLALGAAERAIARAEGR